MPHSKLYSDKHQTPPTSLVSSRKSNPPLSFTSPVQLRYVNISMHYCGYQTTNHPIDTLNDTSSSPGLETKR
jgi:hypothetical protein